MFAGGWSYDAAEAVIGAEQALDGLSGLINKSLINVEERESEARYHFLETIRQYALEKLQELQNAAEPARDGSLVRRDLQHFRLDVVSTVKLG